MRYLIQVFTVRLKLMHKLLAQSGQPLGNIGSGNGFGLLNNVPSGTDALNKIARVVSTIIGLMTLVAGIFFFFQLITASFNWMSASGDKSKLEKAQLQMIQSLTGLIIVVAAFAVASIIGTVLGLDLTLSHQENIIPQLILGP